MTGSLRIAVVHYHLRPGGVTQVIRNAVKSLDPARFQAVVLCGLAPPDTGPAVRVVEELNYAGPGTTAHENALAVRMESAACDALGGPPDVWHIHNHALGKNPALTRAVFQLAERGQRLLLQIHDFAEDGRPANYRRLLEEAGDGDPVRLGARLYPQAAHVHYALLNPRDREFLVAAGCPPDRAHLLPNPVAIDGGEPEGTPPPLGGLFLYPTRAIRRKNIGEFLLWSLLGHPGDRFATTLAPTSPADRAAYDRWVSVARSLGLPVEFEAGRDGRVPFRDLLRGARAVVTTSVAEGFGLAFLEPWLAGRPLAGRDLPEMTREFKAQGVNLDALYERLLVPLAWVGADAFRRKVEAGLAALLREYGREPGLDEVDRAVAAATDGRLVDFGRLDEDLQEIVIRRLARSPSLAEDLRPASLAARLADGEALANNLRVTQEQYGLRPYGERLARIYDGLAGAGPGTLTAPDAGRLLDRFLAPERFFLLRT